MKQITNEEYNEAISDTKNLRVMNSASRKYRKMLGSETEICQTDALLTSLQQFDPARGMQFSTFLYENVKRKCYAEAVRIQRRKNNDAKLFNLTPKKQAQLDSTLILDLTMSLNEKDAKLLSDRFLYNKTLLEISEEYGVTFQAIHQRLSTLTKKIRGILTQ